jgi:hypothetical protein
MEGNAMKTNINISRFLLWVAGTCFLAGNAIAQDDLYYSPSKNKSENSAKPEQINTPNQKATSTMTDYERYRASREAEASTNNNAVNTDTTVSREEKAKMLGQEMYENKDYIPEDQYSEPVTPAEDNGGTTVINNYYSDGSDYSYSSRIRRFDGPYLGYGYYDPFYTDYYWYEPFSWNLGWNIYLGAGFSLGLNWGYPYYGYGCYDPWDYYCYRPSYWYHPYYDSYYHHGYYGGYYDGYYYNDSRHNYVASQGGGRRTVDGYRSPSTYRRGTSAATTDRSTMSSYGRRGATTGSAKVATTNVEDSRRSAAWSKYSTGTSTSKEYSRRTTGTSSGVTTTRPATTRRGSDAPSYNKPRSSSRTYYNEPDNASSRRTTNESYSTPEAEKSTPTTNVYRRSGNSSSSGSYSTPTRSSERSSSTSSGSRVSEKRSAPSSSSGGSSVSPSRRSSGGSSSGTVSSGSRSSGSSSSGTKSSGSSSSSGGRRR